MRAGLTHDFRVESDAVVPNESRYYLAIVDLESYPTFLAKKADRLDLLQHLCAQTDALTAAMWEVPDMPLRLKLILARGPGPGEELIRTHHYVVATGRVRSFGKLCLASQERLLDCARHRDHALARRCRAADPRCPRLLLVPSGVYEVVVYSGSVPVRNGGALPAPDAPDYVVVLRHFPHPRPRLLPIRLPGLAWPLRPAAETPSPAESVPSLPLVNSIPSFCHLQ
jgi:hypothetical protein